MDGRLLRGASLALALGFWLALPGFGEGEAALAGRFSLELGPAESLVSRLSLGSPGLGLRLRSESEAEGLLLRLGLEAGKGPSLLAGPGRVLGAFRLLDNPLSQSRGLGVERKAFELDSSLESGASLLGLELGALACFGLLRGGGGAGLLFGRSNMDVAGPGGEGFGQARPEDWDSGAGGLLLRFPVSKRLGLGLLGSLGLDRGSAGGGGWEPEPPGRAAELSAGLGLLLEGRLEGSSARLGLAWSQGRLAGPGLALRLEAESSGGLLSSSIFAAAATASFRGLEGAPPSGSGLWGLDLGLALFRAARLRFRSRLESPLAEDGRARPFSRSEALELSLPLPTPEPRRLSLEGRLERVEGGSVLGFRGELGGKSAEASWELALEQEFETGAAHGPESGANPLSLSLSTSNRPLDGRFTALGRLGLEFSGAGEAALGELSLELGFGLPAGGLLELRLQFEAVELCPLEAEEPRPQPLLSLSYSRDFGPKAARP